MKNNLLLPVVFTILLTAYLQADPLADARTRYTEGEYAQAAKLFEQALESSPPQAAVLFELGRCLRQNGQDARAALNFRRALVLDPSFTAARVALNETNSDLNLPKTARNSWRDHVLQWIPMDSLTIMGFVLFWLGVFTVTTQVFLRRPNTQGWLFLGILCLAGGGKALTLAWLSDPRVTDRNMALVLTTGGSALLNAPTDQSEKIASLPEGSNLMILSQRGRWFYAQLPDGKNGWLLTEGIIPLIPPS